MLHQITKTKFQLRECVLLLIGTTLNLVKLSYYEDEMKNILNNNVIINTFYLKDRNRASFSDIAKKVNGVCEFLDVNSVNCAQLLTDQYEIVT